MHTHLFAVHGLQKITLWLVRRSDLKTSKPFVVGSKWVNPDDGDETKVDRIDVWSTVSFVLVFSSARLLLLLSLPFCIGHTLRYT